MDLVGILHMVDMPSSGKCDFNYIYAVGVIVSILIHMELVLCESVHTVCAFLSGVHTMFMYWYGCCWLCQECGLVSFFSYCVFSQYFCSIVTGTWCCSVFQQSCVASHPAFGIHGWSWYRLIILLSGSNILFCFQWIVMILLSWFCCTQKFTYTNILMHKYTCAFQSLYPFVILL